MPLPRPSIPDSVRQQVELDAGNRCGYCLTERRYTAKLLHVEHIIPIATGGTSTIDNLWLACDLCNSYKGMATHATDQVSDELAPLFNPRKQKWSEHFRWSEDSIRPFHFRTAFTASSVGSITAACPAACMALFTSFNPLPVFITKIVSSAPSIPAFAALTNPA